MLRLLATLLFLVALPLAPAAGLDAPLPDSMQAAPAGPHPATPEELQLFKDAMKNSQQEVDRWAYTETTHTKTTRGRQKGDTIVRFDPSKPYPEQYTPILIEGKQPTDKQLKEYRKKGEDRGTRIAKNAANAELPPEERKPNAKRNVEPDLEHLQVISDEHGRITYQVALKGDGAQKIPVDKLALAVRIDKTRRTIENVGGSLTEPIRMKLIVKVNSADVNIDFSTIDPKYGPVITTFHGTGEGSALFMKVGVEADRTRADFQRVKPYDERFEVKIGALKTIDQ